MERIEGESDQSGTGLRVNWKWWIIDLLVFGPLVALHPTPYFEGLQGHQHILRLQGPPTYPPPERAGFSTASSSSSAARTSRSLELPWGVEISPIIPERTDHQWVLSIDWHQVLDTVRLDGGEVRRPGGYYILDCVKVRLHTSSCSSLHSRFV